MNSYLDPFEMLITEKLRELQALLLFTAFFVLALNSSAQSEPVSEFQPTFVSEGVLHVEGLDMSGSPSGLEISSEFSVAWNAEGVWRITERRHNPGLDSVTTEIVGFNQVDVITILYPELPLDVSEWLVNDSSLEGRNHPARITRSPFPLDSGASIGILWLAFIGGTYYASLDDDLLMPNLLAANPRNNLRAWVSRPEIELDQHSAMPFIQSAKFYLDPALVSTDLGDFPHLDAPERDDYARYLRDSAELLSRIEQNDILMNSYSVHETQMVNGVNVPSSFSVHQWSFTESPSDAFIAMKIRGTVNSIRDHNDIASATPPIIGTIAVEDRRFRQRSADGYINSVFYQLPEDGWIHSLDDPFFDDIVPPWMIPHVGVSGGSKLGFGILIALILISLPLFILIGGSIKRKKNK